MTEEKMCGDFPLEKELLAPYYHILQARGKALRATIVHAFNHWLKVTDENIHRYFDVLDMLYNAGLLIDDIQDNTLVRRGLPSAHCVFGLPATINASFHVIFLALKKLHDLGLPGGELMSEHFLGVIRGQGLEIYWREKFICPSEEEYKDMIRLKTTSYFLMAVRVIQSSSEDKTDYEKLILLLGEYYQIRDDYCNLRKQEALEEWPSTDDTYAKEACYCDDLTEGKFTLPIIHALRSQTSESEEIRDILRQRTRDVEKKRHCLHLLEKLGSLQYTRDTLRSLDIAARAEVARLGGNRKMESLLDDFLSWQDTTTISA